MLHGLDDVNIPKPISLTPADKTSDSKPLQTLSPEQDSSAVNLPPKAKALNHKSYNRGHKISIKKLKQCRQIRRNRPLLPLKG